MAYTNINIKNGRYEIVPVIVHFSVHKVIGKEWYNMIVETHFLHNESKKSVIKWWEELWNVKSKSTCRHVLDLSWSDDVSECNTHIYHWFEFETTKLTRVDEVIWCCVELKSFSDYLLNEFANCVEKGNRPEQFRRIIWFLVQFKNDNRSGSFEMWRPIS